MTTAPGELLATFPRTLSFKNWPFLILLLLLGGIPAGISIFDGAWGAGLAILGAVLAVPALILGFPYLLEFAGMRSVEALHEQGLVLRRGPRREFVAWSEVKSVEEKDLTTSAGGVGITQHVVSLRLAGAWAPVTMTSILHGPAALEQVVQRLAATAPAGARG